MAIAAVQHDKFSGIAAHDEQPVIGLVKCDRSVLLGFRDTPLRRYLTGAAVHHHEIILIGHIHEQPRAGFFQSHGLDVRRIDWPLFEHLAGFRIDNRDRRSLHGYVFAAGYRVQEMILAVDADGVCTGICRDGSFDGEGIAVEYLDCTRSIREIEFILLRNAQVAVRVLETLTVRTSFPVFRSITRNVPLSSALTKRRCPPGSIPR